MIRLVKPDRGKTKTLKDQAVYVYLPSLEMVEDWKLGVSDKEIAEALLTARFALASTIFATATPGLEFLTGEK